MKNNKGKYKNKYNKNFKIKIFHSGPKNPSRQYRPHPLYKITKSI
jgi:hypothetical protein